MTDNNNRGFWKGWVKKLRNNHRTLFAQHEIMEDKRMRYGVIMLELQKSLLRRLARSVLFF